jgi:Xaa-Pro aminopeptidase
MKMQELKLSFIRCTFNLVDEIWKDKPSRSVNPVVIYDEKYAGEPARSKLEKIAKHDSNKEIDFLILQDLAEIAWVLNLRGSDTPCSPFFYAFVILEFK